jgi:RNA polymerase sigma-70 factor (ECF subfamily)
VQTDDLLTRARRGESDAVEALLREYYDLIHAVCHRMVHNPDSADDAVQNALIAVVKGLPRFDGRSSISTWMYRIATNCAIDEIRRTQRRPVPMADEGLAARGGSVDPTDDLAAHLDQQSQLTAALGRVPEEFRTALVLRYVADLDYAVMAEMLTPPTPPTMTGNSPTGEPR